MAKLNAFAIAVQNLIEQPGVATAPAVYGLLGVTNVEETALPAAVLQYLVGQVAQHFPLQIAGVLELVEQPVVELAVEPVIDVEPRLGRGKAADHRSPAGAVARGEQVLDVGEGEATVPPQHGIVESFVEIEHPVDALRLLQRHGDLCAHDVRHQRQSRAAFLT